MCIIMLYTCTCSSPQLFKLSVSCVHALSLCVCTGWLSEELELAGGTATRYLAVSTPGEGERSKSSAVQSFTRNSHDCLLPVHLMCITTMHNAGEYHRHTGGVYEDQRGAPSHC